MGLPGHGGEEAGEVPLGAVGLVDQPDAELAADRPAGETVQPRRLR